MQHVWKYLLERNPSGVMITRSRRKSIAATQVNGLIREGSCVWLQFGPTFRLHLKDGSWRPSSRQLSPVMVNMRMRPMLGAAAVVLPVLNLFGRPRSSIYIRRDAEPLLMFGRLRVPGRLAVDMPDFGAVGITDDEISTSEGLGEFALAQ